MRKGHLERESKKHGEIKQVRREDREEVRLGAGSQSLAKALLQIIYMDKFTAIGRTGIM